MKLGNTKKSVILIKMMFILFSEHLITLFAKNREEYILKEQGTLSTFPSNLLNEKNAVRRRRYMVKEEYE